MRVTVASGLLLAGALPALAAPPSAAFWNPFRATPADVGGQLRRVLARLLEDVESLAGRTVSRFRLPDPSRIGLRDLGTYTRTFVGLRARTGNPPAPPSPVLGERTVHEAPCSGTPNAPFWAADCSCRCGDPCPEDSNRACEDCRKITRGSRTITTTAQCRAESHIEDFELD